MSDLGPLLICSTPALPSAAASSAAMLIYAVRLIQFQFTFEPHVSSLQSSVHPENLTGRSGHHGEHGSKSLNMEAELEMILA